MIKIIDSYAILAFLEKEPGYQKVTSYFSLAVEKEENLLLSAVNYGEVYYIVLREYGIEKAKEIEEMMKVLPIDIVDVNAELAKEAGSIKAHKKLSYADCFAAALAKVRNGEVITGDKEFKCLQGEIRIAWI
ncbi:MAG: type II toxin-antitoxin system VapC family toxin [Candidatus Firestonebacteria bacterium]